MPGAVSVTVGLTDVPCPCAGIHGTTARPRPAAAAPLGSDERQLDGVGPDGGGRGAKRTAIIRLPESDAST